MKNKNGFTLTELLVVMVLLLAISSSTMIGLRNIEQKSREKQREETIKMIEKAADVYLTTHEDILLNLLNGGTTDGKVCTKIYQLQNDGLLEEDIENPMTNTLIQANLCVYSSVDANGAVVSKFELD